MTLRRLGAPLAAALVVLLGVPASAAAHGIAGRADLPIPEWLFATAASVVLIVSFIGLAGLWATPRLQAEEVGGRTLTRAPEFAGFATAFDALLSVLGLVGFVAVVYCGLEGTQTPSANIGPTLVFVIFWVGVPVLSILFGDVFRSLSPWRTIGRVTGFLTSRLGTMPKPLAYPARLGKWPAALGIVAFAWVELAYGEGNDPSTLALLALGTAAVQLVGMALFGVEAWTRNGDPFGVAFSLYARLSPLQRNDAGGVTLVNPLRRLVHADAGPGLIAVIMALIGTTAFDGFREGPTWGDIAPDLQERFIDLGFSQASALEGAFSVGVFAMPLLVALVYFLGIRGMRLATGSDGEPGTTGRRPALAFAHTFIPIAAAYVVAHYFSLLAYQGQAIAYLASDPLGEGDDIFGTADKTIDYGVISATGIWYVQVVALVAGHVAALVLAHDHALARYKTGSKATLSQMCMLVLMVAFTCLGLWLLSQANDT